MELYVLLCAQRLQNEIVEKVPTPRPVERIRVAQLTDVYVDVARSLMNGGNDVDQYIVQVLAQRQQQKLQEGQKKKTNVSRLKQYLDKENKRKNKKASK